MNLFIGCTSNRYYFGRNYAIICVIVYPILIPVSYFILLFNARHAIMNRDVNVVTSVIKSKTEYKEKREVEELNKIQVVTKIKENTEPQQNIEHIRFLYSAYLPALWYWEVVGVILLRYDTVLLLLYFFF